MIYARVFYYILIASYINMNNYLASERVKTRSLNKSQEKYHNPHHPLT